MKPLQKVQRLGAIVYAMRREKNPQSSSEIQRRREFFKGKLENLLLATKKILIKIQNKLQLFYRNLFKSSCKKPYDNCKKFLDKMTTPVLTGKKLISVKKIQLRANGLNH